MTRVAVLGGGLQGACIALELAAHGVRVDLYEQRERCLAGASAHNEGKIHLGFVYANDPSLRTARAMVRGALAFTPLLRRWLGSQAIDSLTVSSPFHYVVHADSMLGPDAVAAHLDRCRSLLLEEAGGRTLDYLGQEAAAPAVRLSDAETDSLFGGGHARAAFLTPEVGIDSALLARLMRARLADEDLVECRLLTRVRGVEAAAERVTVEFESGGSAGSEPYDHVVNALWDGRLEVDRSAGVQAPRPWLYRLKHYVRVRAPRVADSIPSTTIVLGPYGDTVSYGDGSVYLSWYPAGMRATSSELSPPRWEPVPADPARLREETSAGLAALVPSVAALANGAAESYEAGGGVIIAWGESDIDDRASGLHERHAIGPRSHGRYHSVDTGKLTTAPLFGKLVAERIVEAG